MSRRGTSVLVVLILASVARCAPHGGPNGSGLDGGQEDGAGPSSMNADSGLRLPDAGRPPPPDGGPMMIPDGSMFLPDGSFPPPPPDGGPIDAGPPSLCGDPGFTSNSLGIGQFCTEASNCPSTAPVCSASRNTSNPETNTYFCTSDCTCSTAAGKCGANASCTCINGTCESSTALWICIPNDCQVYLADFYPSNSVCGQPMPDAGPPLEDSGMPLSSSDGGPSGELDSGPAPGEDAGPPLMLVDGGTMGRIVISDYAFSPQAISVVAGANIIVVNEDVGVLHSVTSESSVGQYTSGAVNGIGFDTGTFMGAADGGAERTITIPANAPSGVVIPFFCSFHKSMMPQGEVVVQ